MISLVAFLVLHVSAVAADPIASNVVFDQLTQTGVRLQSGEVVRLPAPTMPDGLDAGQQSAILEKTAGNYGVDRFARKSAVAPFVLEINSIEDDRQQRGGQRVDFYFVAYGSREALFDEALFGDLVGVQEGNAKDKAMSTHTLTDDELRTRNLAPLSDGDTDGDLVESYVAVEAPILERVELQGVGRAVKQKTGESLLGAWMLDERFSDDPDYPNQWRPVIRDAAGRMSLGPPTPYSGLGGYIKLTALHEPAGAIFVECHAAFDEPHEWFDGKNLLRSKLPQAVQENIRTFRRKLANRSEGK